MARIHFKISAALARWRHREAAPSRRFTMMELGGADDRPRGPGWFDSSWDLDHGLAIEVALPGDPAFAAWLEAHARPLTPAASAARYAASPDNTLEFEAVDWQAWATPSDSPLARPGDRTPRPALEELTLDMTPAEQELALVPA